MSRVVLVTGVAGGIGVATAEAFRRAGWSVAGIDRTEAPGTELDAYARLDLGADEAGSRVASFVDGLARVDAVVNNAAVQIAAPMLAIELDDWERTMAVNLRAALLTTRAAHGALSRSRGAVVNVGSVHALATSRGLSAYAASKGGLLALTRAAALELAPDGIRVNAVLPGAVDTAMLRDGVSRWAGDDEAGAIRSLAARTPLGRVGTPADVAEAILFLADDERSSFITGQALVVDGGALARLSTE